MKKRNHRLSRSLPSVSILTPTTANRANVLPLLAKCIERQKYENIVEWLLVDGTRGGNSIDRECLKGFSKCTIRWIELPYDTEPTIGALRQTLNETFVGDIAVCCDDDDYYPPTRVSHAVDKLTKSTAQIAGCTDHLLFDLDMQQAFQFYGFGPRHSTHNSMAYTKTYARGHKYDVTRTFAEESSFTNEFKEPMVQLEYLHAVMHIIHRGNTFDKREHCMRALTGQDQTVRVWRSKANMPSDAIAEYTTQLSPDTSAPTPDVVYYLGGWNPYKWKPGDKSLGGSEQAVMQLSTTWVNRGLTVTVYGEFDEQKLHGVSFKNWRSFSFANTYNNLILWRMYGASPIHRVPRLRAKRLIFDVHDNHFSGFESVSEVKSRFDVVALKSNFHKTCLTIDDNVTVIPNGVRTDMFRPVSEPRDLKRCVWASDYSRGLGAILVYAWPLIRKHEPNATLNVYYGMEGHPEEFQREMKALLSQPGVTDHGRRPQTEVAFEKQRSTFHLYFSTTSAEIDCISIRESAVSGCIPLLSKYNVFGERAGLHIEGDPNTSKGMQHFAACVVSLMHEPNKVKSLQEQLTRLQAQTWSITAERWINDVFKINSDLLRSEVAAFVINLDRREDRFNNFVKRCPMRTTRVSAVDGSNLKDGRGILPGELGCALSHMKVWTRVVDEGLSHAMIFEDDSMFSTSFDCCVKETLRCLPHNFHLCYIGGRFDESFHCESVLFERVSDSLLKYDWNVAWNQDMHDRTTHAYIISRAGARLLLDAFPDMHKYAVDDWMLRTLKAETAQVFSTSVLPCWSPRGGDTDIQRVVQGTFASDSRLITIAATSNESAGSTFHEDALAVN